MSDEPTEKLAPADDPHVTEFRRRLAQVRAWQMTCQTDAQVVSEEAASIVVGVRDLLVASGLADPLHYRFVMEARDTSIDPDWPDKAKELRQVLMGAVRVLREFGPVLMPTNVAMTIAGDCYHMANGDPSMFSSVIPRPKKRAERPTLVEGVKAQIARLAHYNAGLKDTTWGDEYALIYPNIGVDARRDWNRVIGDAERQDCRRVGRLTRAGKPLTQEDVKIAAQATRNTAAELRDRLTSLL